MNGNGSDLKKFPSKAESLIMAERQKKTEVKGTRKYCPDGL